VEVVPVINRFRFGALVLAMLTSGACIAVAIAAPQADSVILLIGDGLGPGHIAMVHGALGRPLAIERAPFSGTAVTTSLGGGITDSAAAGTALATGHKTTNGMVAASPDGERLKSILEICRENGKAVAVVTTDALWGATPASFLAHAASRRERSDIALQVAQSGAQVLLGHGSSEFLPATNDGARTDGKDLVAEARAAAYEVAANRYELLTAQQPRILGLFEDDAVLGEPRLRDMVTAALSRVGADPDGFLVVIEHSGLDGDPGDPAACLADMLEIDEAVAAATEYADARGRTLVVITGDHDTGGLVVERPERLPALLKVGGSAEDIAPRLTDDRANVTAVMSEFAGVTDLTPAELQAIKTAEDAEAAIGAVVSARCGLKWTGRGHTATPVPVYAFGPGAQSLVGPIDNTDIPTRIADALGLELATASVHE
jgi:alkaline phosphatase